MAKQLPKSIRFEEDTEKQIQELGEIFNEPPVKVLHRAVAYLYQNRAEAVENEANERRIRIQKQKQ